MTFENVKVSRTSGNINQRFFFFFLSGERNIIILI